MKGAQSISSHLDALWSRSKVRQVGTAAAGAHRAPRSLINSYISGENDEKPAAQRKIDERELQQTHRSIIFIASRRKYVK